MPLSPLAQAIIADPAVSTVRQIKWPQRDRAPLGFIKGLALCFARVQVKLLGGDAAAQAMATARTADAQHDVLAWYDPEYQVLDMRNDTAGVDTLRHLFVLLYGLGMRESSGKHCEGRDVSATNTKAETAEAGLFQTSFNARTASPLLPLLFAQYRASPSGFLEVFREGVTCTAANLENFGDGDGKEFQRLSKECPAFAAEFAALGLRHIRKHWGPINTKKAEVRDACDVLLRSVQQRVETATPAERATLL